MIDLLVVIKLDVMDSYGMILVIIVVEKDIVLFPKNNEYNQIKVQKSERTTVKLKHICRPPHPEPLSTWQLQVLRSLELPRFC